MIPAFKMQNIWGKLYLTWIFLKVKHKHLLVAKYLTSVRYSVNEQAAMQSKVPVCLQRLTNKPSREGATLNALFLMGIVKEAWAIVHLESKCLHFLTVNTVSWDCKPSIKALTSKQMNLHISDLIALPQFRIMMWDLSEQWELLQKAELSLPGSCFEVYSQWVMLFWETVEPLGVKA